MELNEIIKQHRIDKGLTQEQLADQLFITRQSISRWETGKVNPPLNALYDLAKFYNLSLEDFLGGNKKMTQSKLNFLSLLGSIIFNFFVISTFGVILLSLWLSAWVIIIMFTISPVILLVVSIFHFQDTTWLQIFLSFVLLTVGGFSFKPLIYLSKVLAKTTVRYFRYNLANIFYEIEDK